jgi:hypothetical protein
MINNLTKELHGVSKPCSSMVKASYMEKAVKPVPFFQPVMEEKE